MQTNNGDDNRRLDQRHDLEGLDARLQRLEDMHISFLASVQFRPGTEYNQTLLAHNIYGDMRIALTMVMTAIMTRALGETKTWGNVHNFPENAQRAAFVFQNGPITRKDAVRAIALVTDKSEATADLILNASRDSGYALEAHRALGD